MLLIVDFSCLLQDGIEECRKLCGGHSYLCTSGLPELFAVYVPACTYEGENIVLLLQVARFLMKTVSQLGSGKQPVGTIAYMKRDEHLMQCRCNVERVEDWLKPSAVVEAFEARATRMSIACAQNLSKFANPEEGFAELSTDLVEAAVAHCQLIVFSKWLSAPAVESVNVIMPPPGHPPLSAVVAFIDASAVTVVLGGGSSARHIMTDGREMWVSAYGQFSSLRIY
ncbi:peroxisomal acyl-coenzyme A oxidase 1-like isoform X2 [Actinidia eriantha]|uniref:peroxisomal acyl-coenzyme A oxidase 1-like isoform X2 n=1 Tax=Actinidia eriantha TaxID=165200 RepID=UPI00258983A5|nr:peroxisomal acyl-coenzyme A oxidase 1-like isoform X2 [Actinidia eriantha]